MRAGAVSSKILIVDDNVMELKFLNTLLTKEGYVCLSVESGEEALSKLEHFLPDLILTDYQMRGMSGLELLRKIQEDGHLVGVILMTGSSELDPVVQAIRWGAYEYLLKPVSNDAVLLSVARVLSKSKRVVENERFHSYVEKTFRRYVDPGVLDVLMAAHQTTTVESKKMIASVFFSDIRNFSDLFSSLDVKEMIALLNEYYFKPASELVLAHTGTVDKFIGDGVMAVFGAPTAFEGFAQKAVDAAIALQEITAVTRKKGKHPFHIGIGIATGEVLSGNVGSPRRMDFTVMGNAVTIAARLEKLAGPGMVLVDAATRELLSGACVVSDPLNVHLKGQKSPSNVYEVRCKRELAAEVP